MRASGTAADQCSDKRADDPHHAADHRAEQARGGQTPAVRVADPDDDAAAPDADPAGGAVVLPAAAAGAFGSAPPRPFGVPAGPRPPTPPLPAPPVSAVAGACPRAGVAATGREVTARFGAAGADG